MEALRRAEIREDVLGLGEGGIQQIKERVKSIRRQREEHRKVWGIWRKDIASL